MDTRFFTSKEFLISGLIALVILGAGVAASGAVFESGIRSSQGCSVPAPPGQALDPRIQDTGVNWDGDRFERVVTYTLDQAPDGPATLDLCTNVGDVEITPSSDGEYRVQAVITNDGPGADEAVDRTRVTVAMTEANGRLHIAADQPHQVNAQRWFESRSTRVDIELQVPPGHAHALDVRTDVGDITLAALAFGELDLVTDVGDVDGQGISLEGPLEARTDVGDIDLALASVATATYELRTDVGDIDLALPSTEDTGYDVEASADVGGVDVAIGPTEHRSHDSSGASEETTARSEGYAEKAHRVRIDAQSDVGSIEITAT